MVFFVFVVLFVELGLSFFLSAVQPQKTRWVLLACYGRVREQENEPNRRVNYFFFIFEIHLASRAGPAVPHIPRLRPDFARRQERKKEHILHAGGRDLSTKYLTQ